MIHLIHTEDPYAIKAVLSPGMTNRAREGYCGHRTPDDAISAPNNTFLLAHDDGKPVGFIMFETLSLGHIAIHVYLRTKGQKTREACRIAIAWARNMMGSKAIYAYFCGSRLACSQLAEDLGFIPDDDIASIYPLPDCHGFIWRRLDL